MPYQIKITADEMVRAKTDQAVLNDILEKLQSYIQYVVYLVQLKCGVIDVYISREDIEMMIKQDIVRAIKYYSPQRYAKETDRTNRRRYLNGYSYIFYLTPRFVRSIVRNMFPKKYKGSVRSIPVDAVHLSNITEDMNSSSVHCERSVLRDLVMHSVKSIGADDKHVVSMLVSGFSVEDICKIYQWQYQEYRSYIRGILPHIKALTIGSNDHN